MQHIGCIDLNAFLCNDHPLQYDADQARNLMGVLSVLRPEPVLKLKNKTFGCKFKFQLEMFWLNATALKNIPLIITTFAISQLLIF